MQKLCVYLIIGVFSTSAFGLITILAVCHPTFSSIALWLVAGYVYLKLMICVIAVCIVEGSKKS